MLMAAGLSTPVLGEPITAASATPAEEVQAAVNPTELEGITVKAARQRKPTLAESLAKAMQPKGGKVDSDLNHASAGMQKMAAWLGDPDAYRQTPAHGALAPPGDETNGCGADLSQGCEQQR